MPLSESGIFFSWKVTCLLLFSSKCVTFYKIVFFVFNTCNASSNYRNKCIIKISFSLCFSFVTISLLLLSLLLLFLPLFYWLLQFSCFLMFFCHDCYVFCFALLTRLSYLNHFCWVFSAFVTFCQVCFLFCSFSRHFAFFLCVFVMLWLVFPIFLSLHCHLWPFTC